jgi:hypothetical protein
MGFSLRKTAGNLYYCKVDGQNEFFVGKRVRYAPKGSTARFGLYNVYGGSPLKSINYKSQDFNSDFGFWAEVIEPTAIVEGRSFVTLNTYDRAMFTFGFGQFGAHVPNGDFVQYFSKILMLPEAQNYFPDLTLHNERICKVQGSGKIVLENNSSTQGLMNYINPDSIDIQDSEAIFSAKLIHLTANNQAARVIQTEVLIDNFKDGLVHYDKIFNLNNKTARTCLIILDIYHQGRGGSNRIGRIKDALANGNTFEDLTNIGKEKYKERCELLKKSILANPRLFEKRWNKNTNEFS